MRETNFEINASFVSSVSPSTVTLISGEVLEALISTQPPFRSILRPSIVFSLSGPYSAASRSVRARITSNFTCSSHSRFFRSFGYSGSSSTSSDSFFPVSARISAIFSGIIIASSNGKKEGMTKCPLDSIPNFALRFFASSVRNVCPTGIRSTLPPSSSNSRSRSMEHSTFAKIVLLPSFSSSNLLAMIAPHWSALSSRPLSSTSTALSPSPSKATPKAVGVLFTSSFNALKLDSVGSDGLLGKEGSGLGNSGSTFSFTRLITSIATSPMLPFPQSTTILPIFGPVSRSNSSANFFAMYSMYSSLKSSS